MNCARPWLPALLLLGACAVRLPSGEEEREGESESESSGAGEASGTGESSDAGETSTTGLAPDQGSPTPWVPEQDGCDVASQAGCRPGQKCVPTPEGNTWSGAAACVPVLGDGQAGDACVYDFDSSTDDCGADTTCWNFEDFGEQFVGSCAPFCGGVDDPQCPLHTSCVLGLCMDSCDPLAQDCPAGTSCYWVSNVFWCSFGSWQWSGEPCGFVNDCPGGMVCLSAASLPDCAGAACCTNYCDLGSPSCPGDLSCVPFFDANTAPLGYEHVGVCVVV